MPRVALVSYRLGGVDGVSVEAAKWAHALGALGHRVVSVAGEGTADRLVAGLDHRSPEPPRLDEVADALSDVDLVVVENVASLPLKPAVRETLYRVLEDRPVLFRHHDASFEREALGHLAPPRLGRHWRHVAISHRLARGLRARGVPATTIHNHFDPAPREGRRDATRDALEVSGPLVVLPSRALARKNVPAAMRLADALDADLWIVGAAEDGYEEDLRVLRAAHPGRVLRGLPDGFDIADAYAASDLVAFTSRLEGFGNPAVEGGLHGRAVAVTHYPVLDELRALGLCFVEADDLSRVRAALVDPSRYARAAREAVREHLDLADLPAKLARVLAGLLESATG